MVHVESIRKRLTYAFVGEAGRLRARGVPANKPVAQARVLRDLERVDSLEVSQILRLDQVAEGQLTGLQTVRDRGRVRHDLEDVLVNVRRALPVIGVLAHDHLVALAPLLKLKRTAEHGGFDIFRRGIDLILGCVGQVLAEHLRREHVTSQIDDR